MAKLTCLIVLIVTVMLCAEGMRIDPAPMPSPRPGESFPIIKENDPRCKGDDGILPNPEDCTMYIKCVKGTSQDLKCPEGFKFDSRNHCTPGENADCGRMMIREFREDEQCPEYYGWFKVESDCHKFMVCIAGVPTIKSCPEHYVYNDVNGACVEGDKCPISPPDESVCKKANEIISHDKDCKKFIKCVNFKAKVKNCPPGTAFDPELKRCTEQHFEKCKNNDILNIARL